MTVGSIALSDGTMSAPVNPSGFNRHTFLCGQSGSGKTYSLGVILEQLILSTDLRIVILDPNADYVHLNTLAASNIDGGSQYLDRVRDLHVYRSGQVAAGELPLRIRFSDLSLHDQARTLQLDPLAERDEFHVFKTAVNAIGDRAYDLQDIQNAVRQNLSEAALAVMLRIMNLGVGDWSVWAKPDESSLRDLLGTPWKSVVLDISRFPQSIQRSVVALAVLRALWNRREQRQPVLVVIDEAHNICPPTAVDAIQKAATDLLITIATEGRKYGIYLLISTQRPDKVHPHIVSQCDNLILMRMNSKRDLDDLADTFAFVPRGMLERSSTFRQGEALFAGNIVPAPSLLQIGKRLSAEGGADIPTTWATPPTS